MTGVQTCALPIYPDGHRDEDFYVHGQPVDAAGNPLASSYPSVPLSLQASMSFPKPKNAAPEPLSSAERERVEHHLNRFLTRYGEGFMSDDTLRSVAKLCHVDIEHVKAIWSEILSEYEAVA